MTDVLNSLLPELPVVLLIVWFAPAWGRRVLAFLRDLDDYKERRRAKRDQPVA